MSEQSSDERIGFGFSVPAACVAYAKQRISHIKEFALSSCLWNSFRPEKSDNAALLWLKVKQGGRHSAFEPLLEHFDSSPDMVLRLNLPR